MQTDGFKIFEYLLAGIFECKILSYFYKFTFLCLPHLLFNHPLSLILFPPEKFKNYRTVILQIHRSKQNALRLLSHSKLFKDFQEHGAYKKYLFYFRSF